jgi:hypothetical protein
MKKTLRGKLTYSNVISTLCLFLLIGGGTAFAATQLAKNSVGTKQIKKNAVTTAKIKKEAVAEGKIKNGAVTTAKIASGAVNTAQLADNAVSTSKLANDSVTGQKVKANSLTGADINESTLGQVPDAAKLGGKPPTSFTSSSIYRNESAVEAGVPFGAESHYIDEACNPGDVLLAGGPANVNDTSTMLESFPTPGLTNSWRVRLKTPAADNFSVVVLCAKQS